MSIRFELKIKAKKKQYDEIVRLMHCYLKSPLSERVKVGNKSAVAFVSYI